MPRNNSLRSRRRTRRKTTKVSRKGRVRKSVSRRRLSRRSNARRNVSRKKNRRLIGGGWIKKSSDGARHEGSYFQDTKHLLGKNFRKYLGGKQKLRKHAAYSCRVARKELDQIKEQLPQAINDVVSQCKLAEVKAAPVRDAFEDVFKKKLEELYQETNKAAIALGGDAKETIAAFNELMPEAERLQEINKAYKEFIFGDKNITLDQLNTSIDDINKKYTQEVERRQDVLAKIKIEGVGQGAFAGDVARKALKVGIVARDEDGLQIKKDGDMDLQNHLYYHKLTDEHIKDQPYNLTLKNIEVGGERKNIDVSVTIPESKEDKEKNPDFYDEEGKMKTGTVIQINYETLAKEQGRLDNAVKANIKDITTTTINQGNATTNDGNKGGLQGT